MDKKQKQMSDISDLADKTQLSSTNMRHRSMGITDSNQGIMKYINAGYGHFFATEEQPPNPCILERLVCKQFQHFNVANYVVEKMRPDPLYASYAQHSEWTRDERIKGDSQRIKK